MPRRINITLPEETLDLIDRVAHPSNRSRFIDEAIKHSIEEIGRNSLRTNRHRPITIVAAISSQFDEILYRCGS